MPAKERLERLKDMRASRRTCTAGANSTNNNTNNNTMENADSDKNGLQRGPQSMRGVGDANNNNHHNNTNNNNYYNNNNGMCGSVGAAFATAPSSQQRTAGGPCSSGSKYSAAAASVGGAFATFGVGTYSGTYGAPGPSASNTAALRAFQKSLSPPKYRKDPTPLVSQPSEAHQKDLWATMAQQAQLEHEQRLLRERLGHAMKMDTQRKILDMQVALRDQQRMRERAERLAERPLAQKAHEEWVAESERKKAAEAERMAAMGADRVHQIELKKERRAEEAEHEREADRAVLANIAILNEQERQRREAARERKLAVKAALIEANEALKQRQAEAREEDKALEIKLVEGMRAKELNDHERRMHDAAVFQQRVHGKEEMALDIQATLEQRQRADEERANRIAAERKIADAERLRIAAEQKEREKEAALRVRDLQLEAHRLAKAEAEAARQRERAELTEQYRQEVAKVREEHARDRAKLEAQRRLLEDQMWERQHLHPILVSSEEMKLNAALLQRAERDQRLHTTLPLAPSSSSSSPHY